MTLCTVNWFQLNFFISSELCVVRVSSCLGDWEKRRDQGDRNTPLCFFVYLLFRVGHVFWEIWEKEEIVTHFPICITRILELQYNLHFFLSCKNMLTNSYCFFLSYNLCWSHSFGENAMLLRFLMSMLRKGNVKTCVTSP